MITDYGLPRKTPDLYSSELYEEICSELNIKDHLHKKYFKETIERAALSFLNSKEKNDVRFTKVEEKKELQKLSSYLKKSNDLYKKISDRSQMTSFRLLEGLQKSEISHNETKEVIMALVYDGIFVNSKAIGNILSVLLQASENAIESDYAFSRENKTELVLQWLWFFSNDWEEISKMTISEGRYDEALLKYDSPAMRILDKLAKPLEISN